MGTAQVRPLNFEEFWTRLGRQVLKMMAKRAHAEVTVVLHDGVVQPVKITEKMLPSNLPDS